MPPSSVADRASDDPAERFGLAGLTVLPIPNIDNIATIYTHAQKLRAQQLQGSTQDALIYYNATAAHLDALDGNYPGRITFFGDEIGLLFFRMTGPVHECAHAELFKEIQDIISRMNLKRYYTAAAASRYKGNGTKEKEGDSGIRPDPPRWAGNHYPTLVIEAGDSESLLRLYRDKDWWFDNSSPTLPQGDVRIVLLVKAYKTTKRLVIEQWHRLFYQSPSASVEITPHPHKPLSLRDSSHWVVKGGTYGHSASGGVLTTSTGTGDGYCSDGGLFY
jgi:hypothetical protein